jgi:hypothetical protein
MWLILQHIESQNVSPLEVFFRVVSQNFGCSRQKKKWSTLPKPKCLNFVYFASIKDSWGQNKRKKIKREKNFKFLALEESKKNSEIFRLWRWNSLSFFKDNKFSSADARSKYIFYLKNVCCSNTCTQHDLQYIFSVIQHVH